MISNSFRLGLRSRTAVSRSQVVATALRGGGAYYPGTLRCFASAPVADVVDETPTEPVKVTEPESPKMLDSNLRPSEVVQELNKHIVGQEDAKKAVAIAMRNRWRRMQLPNDLKKEVTPRNVLLVGPTGCGKTEVARRMAMLNDAPFRTCQCPVHDVDHSWRVFYASSHIFFLCFLLYAYYLVILVMITSFSNISDSQSRWKLQSLRKLVITDVMWIRLSVT